MELDLHIDNTCTCLKILQFSFKIDIQVYNSFKHFFFGENVGMCEKSAH